jgi:hypothetical protein
MPQPEFLDGMKSIVAIQQYETTIQEGDLEGLENAFIQEETAANFCGTPGVNTLARLQPLDGKESDVRGSIVCYLKSGKSGVARPVCRGARRTYCLHVVILSLAFAR